MYACAYTIHSQKQKPMYMYHSMDHPTVLTCEYARETGSYKENYVHIFVTDLYSIDQME